MTSTSPAEGPALTGARRFGVLLALCLAVLVLGLDTTVLNVALPTLAADLDQMIKNWRAEHPRTEG